MGCVKKGGKGISCPWGVSRRVGKGVPAHGVCEEGWERELVPMGCVKKGGKGSSLPMGCVKRKGGWGVKGRVCPPAHGVCPTVEEGWEREFLPMGCVKKGGGVPAHGVCQEGWEREGSSCPWGVSRRVGKGVGAHGLVCVKKGGKGSSCPRGVKKGGKGSSCPWGVSRRVGKGFPAHGVCQEGWERDFPPTGCVKSKKKPQPLWNGWGFF